LNKSNEFIAFCYALLSEQQRKYEN